MTKNKAHHATNYVFQTGEGILVDTNVWLFLQPPAAQPPPHYAFRYSAALKNLVAARARPFVDSLILSEYLNRFWQIEWRAWQKLNPGLAGQFPKPKDFRKCPHFTPIAGDAIANVSVILKMCGLADTQLQQLNLQDVLTEFSAGTFDLNDGIIIDSCRLSGWKLLTDDGDMTSGGIEVLTTNPKLINACP